MNMIKKNNNRLKKTIGLALIALIIITIFAIATVYFILFFKKTNTETIDTNKLIDIEILATEEQIEFLKKNVDTEPYIKVDVLIDGTKIENCGLRTKGSSIYEQIKNTSNQTRFGYTLELDYYQQQSYDGITKFLLNTGLADKTCMKEMICYDIYEKAGVKTVKRCFCNLKMGTKEEGIYTLVEVPAENYIERYYGNNDGIIYKPKIKNADENKNVLDIIKIEKGKKYGGNYTEDKKNKLIQAFENIEKNNNMEKYVDISSMIDYLVVCFLIDNCDSYIAPTSRNYYIYQQNEKITFIPFDLNAYFWDTNRIYQSVMSYKKYQSTDKKPIVFNILNDTKYILEYKSKMDNLIDDLNKNDYIYKRIDFYKKLIDNSLKNNRNNFYSYEEFKDSIDSFKEIMKIRLQYAKNNLNGVKDESLYKDLTEQLDKINDYILFQ